MDSKVHQGEETITSYNIGCCVKGHIQSPLRSLCAFLTREAVYPLLLPRELFDRYMIRANRKFKARCSWRANKRASLTNLLERFNNTLRQRVSRLVREALSFSKKLANHIGAIKLFICYYNLPRA